MSAKSTIRTILLTRVFSRNIISLNSLISKTTLSLKEKSIVDKMANPNVPVKRQDPFPLPLYLGAAGFILAIIGFIVSNSYSKESTANLAGFEVELMGLVMFIIGVAGTIASYTKNRSDKKGAVLGQNYIARLLQGSIWLTGIGLALLFVGFILGNNYSTGAEANFVGFDLLLTGIGIFVFGIFGSVTAALKTRIEKAEEVNGKRASNEKILLCSVLASGVGAVLTAIGFTIANTFSKGTFMNNTGFVMLLTGIITLVLGIFTAASSTLNISSSAQNQMEPYIERKNKIGLLVSVWAVGLGVAFIISGYLLGNAYSKEAIGNQAGFFLLLAGIPVMILGASGTIALGLRRSIDKKEKYVFIKSKPRVFTLNVLSTGAGASLITVGSIVSSAYAKSTQLNLAGFGMLLSGICIFVYSAFELSRLYTTCYIYNKQSITTANPLGCLEKPVQKKDKFSVRFKRGLKYATTTRAVFNLAGMMSAIGLLFFSLWQLDIIVSGPVWWESSPTGKGWAWNGPGAYQRDYFQCFLWKTTVGQAYDTFFALIFVSFIILFISAFFYPRPSAKTVIKN
jgi:hypothetical protein